MAFTTTQYDATTTGWLKITDGSALLAWFQVAGGWAMVCAVTTGEAAPANDSNVGLVIGPNLNNMQAAGADLYIKGTGKVTVMAFSQ